MKKMMLLLVFVIVFPAIVLGQLKSQNDNIDIRNEILKPLTNSAIGLGLFDPSKLSMNHSFSLSYFSFGGESISQSMYLNTLNYQISDPLSLSVQWGIRAFPHNSFGNNSPLFNSGLFFSGAELNYRPTDNLFIKFEVNRMPYYNSYRYPYRPYQSNFWNEDGVEN